MLAALTTRLDRRAGAATFTSGRSWDHRGRCRGSGSARSNSRMRFPPPVPATFDLHLTGVGPLLRRIVQDRAAGAARARGEQLRTARGSRRGIEIRDWPPPASALLQDRLETPGRRE